MRLGIVIAAAISLAYKTRNLAMDTPRRIEWIRCEGNSKLSEVAQFLTDADPSMWKRVAPPCLFIQDIEEAPGWYTPIIFLELDGKSGLGVDGLRLLGKCWIYNIEAADDNDDDMEGGLYKVGRVAVREVPPCLVFGCEISVSSTGNRFRAVFTTLAGNKILRIENASMPLILTLGCLVRMVRKAARTNGFLQSWNQEVRVLLNGELSELTEQTVLWNQIQQNGWLQLRD